MKTNRTRIATLAVAFFCGALAAQADKATITGKALFKGEKAKRTVLKTDKDPKCKLGKAKIGSFDLITNKTDPMTVRNVMVYIKSGLPEGATFEVPGNAVTLTQVGCEYSPHVLGMMEGQTLTVSNGDDTNHNIHFLPKVNEELNFSQPKKGMTKDLQLVAEDVFKVKCDVHPWMAAYIGVFEHPFYTVVGKDGTFKIEGLPAGTYTVEAWHESLGTQTMEVTVAVDETVEKDFTFEKK